MAPRFGTSGLRGLVEELTDGLVADHVRAFLSVTRHSGELLIGRDLRPSSARIAEAVISAAAECGLRTFDCGVLPTPALAMAAMQRDAPAIMVTGSHIPADRNGLKFYTPEGEITKQQEKAIVAALSGPTPAPRACATPMPAAARAYIDRHVDFLPDQALAGLTIGVWQHSSVARDLLPELLRRLGARVIELDRSQEFVPVDTEAVDTDTRRRLQDWVRDLDLDAIVSTDGDADRPLVANETGRVVPGDILGLLTAAELGADTVVTPVSSNTAIERCGLFARVIRTRIGSPHVIAGMKQAMADPAARVAGFEANGGFLLGFSAKGRVPLSPLLTRDAMLPILAILARAARHGTDLSDLLAGLPGRRTAADRLQEIPTEQSASLVAALDSGSDLRARLLAGLGAEDRIDRTDGLRISLTDGAIVHLRPSGNAPELRVYVEADDQQQADELLALMLNRVRNLL
ncbi:phosphomannomutase [Albidovulum inexpectatum]|uniref:Phosphomannomutase n=1 Tax=Albidovulum inexpectatum TaxID=196587 RepID=A0A2S5JK23_9RHOB|nr:phosphomannomutase [Albidovulum inexpectatum]PPB81605.1 phosphomannomutase [Albidovulum inexpectatum]